MIGQRNIKEPNWEKHACNCRSLGGKVSDLISRFNQGGDAGKHGINPSYKHEYGVGRQVGQLQQTKFH
uniref:Uncharacterized protein n=1 Tax=Panagrolaimus sp. JU765 TaxID=591449 RepID=A0AC34QMS5_9BILA